MAVALVARGSRVGGDGEMADFSRQYRLGIHADGSVYVDVLWRDGRLSITGVIGPDARGDARGSCGQIVDHLRDDIKFAEGWDRETVDRLADIWERWHLNHCTAGTQRQEEHLRTLKGQFPGYPMSHYEWAKEELAKVGLQPDDGYSYGSAWLHEEVPAEIIDWLANLPEGDKVSPWGPPR